MSAVSFRDVSFRYPGVGASVLNNVSLNIPEGEFVLVVGATGSGKSTLLKAMSGLVPRFTGGLLTGEVHVSGRSTQDFAPRDLADVIGTVGQDPSATFVADTVEDEVAYVMENLGVAPDAMRRRVEDSLDLLDLVEIRQRPLDQLSGGQQQRVAIAAVLSANPDILVLDEPTSALDPAAADEVLSALQRLVHDLGLTVIIAEHRLERVVQFADTVILVPGGGNAVASGQPTEMLKAPSPRPPVVRLAELAGWDPIPLTVRNARRAADMLRDQLGEPPDAEINNAAQGGNAKSVVVDGLWASYGAEPVLRDLNIEINSGEIMALMGRNGTGKSTLLAHLSGQIDPARGSVCVNGVDPHLVSARELIRSVGLVPQDSSVLLFAETVAEECATSDKDSGLAEGTTGSILNRMVSDIDYTTHPRDLSEGQRLSLALSVILAPQPAVVCLDEPTRGLDHQAKAALIALLRDLAAKSHTVIVATHDVELVAELAHRVVVLADGDVVADGPARKVICHSPVFSPQVSRVLAPSEWLTVHEVSARLSELGEL